MRFSKVIFSAPKGLEIVVRGSSQSVYQLETATGWTLESSEYGVIASHPSRSAKLFVAWPLLGPCDILDDSEPVGLEIPGLAKTRPVGRPRLSP